MSDQQQEVIPELPEELTADWLSGAFGETVQTVEREILGQGQGFLGDIIRLTLTGAPALPDTLIAKLPKKANRVMGEMLGVYEREVLFFQEMADRVPVRMPAIHYSHYDPDAGSAKQKEILKALDGLPGFFTPAINLLGQKIAGSKGRRYLILMEDLAEFSPGDQFEGANPEACARVLEQFAPAHRAFWGSEELQERFWLLPMDIDARMRQGMYRRVVPLFLKEVDDTLAPYVEWLGEHHAALTRALSADAPATLIHCDLRLDNVCFDGERCAYLDWQLTRSGPAAYDVAYFLSSALAASADAATEDEILRRYFQALDAPDYPFETFYRDYQRGLVLTLSSLMPTPDIAIDAGRGQEMMARWRERLAARLARVDVNTLF